MQDLSEINRSAHVASYMRYFGFHLGNDRPFNGLNSFNPDSWIKLVQHIMIRYGTMWYDTNASVSIWLALQTILL